MVSTVFLGVDHNFVGGSNPPVLFEAAVFYHRADGPQVMDEHFCRASTWDEALAQHAEVVAWLAAPPRQSAADVIQAALADDEDE